MNILLSNDDGIMSAGMAALAAVLKKKHELYVSAPSAQQSAVSRCMTLFKMIGAEPYCIEKSEEVPAFAVTGTPVDCVRLGLGNLFRDIKFDLVVSGINHGPNLGTDTLYSGTVAAAAEAALLGYQAIAVSIEGSRPQHFETAAYAALWAVDYIAEHKMPFGTVFNLNVPDIPFDEIKGIKKTCLGYQEYELPFIEEKTPDGKTLYRPPTDCIKKISGSTDADCIWMRRGYATVTPIGYDLTHYEALNQINLDEGALSIWKTC